MKSPQSPHSSSLWVFALSHFKSYRPLSTSALKSLGYYTFFYGFSVVGLRVISIGSNRSKENTTTVSTVGRKRGADAVENSTKKYHDIHLEYIKTNGPFRKPRSTK